MSLFETGFNLPPGVTGNEPQISGEWPCENCGQPLPEEANCYKCGEPMEWDDEANDWWCEKCDIITDGNKCPWGCPEPDSDCEYQEND